MAKTATSALVLWLTTAAAMMGLVARFNVGVDPFGYFGTNSIGYYFSSERQFKYNLVRRYDYNAILLGDSRMAYVDPAYVDAPGFRFVNGGIAGASLSEQLNLLRASRVDRLQLAVIGLRYQDLLSCGTPRAAGATTPFDTLRYAISWGQLRDSVVALFLRASGRSPRFHEDGTREVSDKAIADATRQDKTERYWQQLEDVRSKVPADPSAFKLGPGCRQSLAAMADLARRHDFKLILVLWPANSDLLTRVHWTDPAAEKKIETFLDELRRVAPKVVDFSMSPLGDSRNFWLDDALHLKPRIGAKIVALAIARPTRATGMDQRFSVGF